MIESTLSLNTWKRFVNEGVLDSSRLNKMITESWYRSRDAQVNPNLGMGSYVLTKDQFHSQKEKNSLLLDIAQPHLERMKHFTKELGMMALLIDPEGYVLFLTGNREVKNEAQKINFVQGVRWTESEVGTNAIGTALQTGAPIMVTGTEHYSIASHRWSCAASPIRTDDGKVIGILDVTCPLDRTHPYMLGIVTSAAYSIERDISIRLHKDEMELIYCSMDIIETDQPVLICNHKQHVVAASRSIRQIPEWKGMKGFKIKEYGFLIQMEVPMFSNDHGGLIGKCIYLMETSGKEPDKLYPAAKPFYCKGEVGKSKSFQQTLDEMKHVAPTDASVYILGETGTGKEVIAQSIHENSSRKNGPFIAVNCGAIPKELMESELFGYAEGAFTGARRQGYKGKFEQANHGTIFLDEIGEIPHSMQVALLRVLQERKITPVGSTKEIPLDIRIIAATHRDLRQLVNEGKFREDLYYRLHVYPIQVPPLRERKEDIPHLVRYFCQTHHWEAELPPEFFDRLMEYHWPGNIRELFNVLERLQILSQGGRKEPLQMLDLLDSFDWIKMCSTSQTESLKIEVSISNSSLTLREKIQKEQMIDALQRTKGNVSLAAQLLAVPRSTFYKRLQKFNL
ncbi:MAG TPA: sigma-54-dependent Fis family transcriptional regulator [Bacillota bacterium]|nr:sigma-54-dependent Fis family transcriptional regulator [Bacillota bacterium]